MPNSSVIYRNRAVAERQMVDACLIKRAGATLYDGKCEVAQDEAQAVGEEGEAYALDLRLVLKLPMSVTDLQLGDEATITASTYDPDLVGRVLRIQSVAHETYAVARRVFCTERTGDMYLRGDDDRSWKP